MPEKMTEAHQDAELLATDDPDVFGQLVVRYQRPLFGFLGRMGFAMAVAEELAQETFLRAWRSRGSYVASKSAPSTWLFTIARNLALNEIERRGRLPIFAGEPDDQISDSRGPEAQYLHDHDDRRLALRAALQTLPAAERLVLALAYVDELDSNDASAILGCSSGAFRTRLSRARKRLANQLDDQ